MKIFTCYSEDDTQEHWLLFEDVDGRLVVRKEYSDLACSSCGKIDEQAALKRGVSRSFRVRAKKDWIGTSDDYLCVTKRFRDLVENEGLCGLEFLEIPAEPNHYVVNCINLVETDEVMAGFENRRLCPTCRRFSERLVGPLLAGLAIPAENNVFFASAIANENVRVSYRPIFIPERILKTLEREKIEGVDFVASF